MIDRLYYYDLIHYVMLQIDNLISMLVQLYINLLFLAFYLDCFDISLSYILELCVFLSLYI